MTQLFDSVVFPLLYLLSAILFILGIKGLTHPRTAVRGNMLGALGMPTSGMLGPRPMPPIGPPIAHHPSQTARIRCGTFPSAFHCFISLMLFCNSCADSVLPFRSWTAMYFFIWLSYMASDSGKRP